MRILIIVHNLTGGGAERVASLWATGFVQRGFEVAIALNCPNTTPVTYSVPSSIKFYNSYCWLSNKLEHVFGLKQYRKLRLSRIISDFKPDVIVGVLGDNALLAAEIVANWENKPFIVQTEHNAYERPFYAPMPKDVQYRKLVTNKKFSCVTVLTKADKDYIGSNANNIVVLPNPLAYAPAESVPHKENIILAAGRLDAWSVKGFDLLIKAWGMIAQDYPSWKLQIAGDCNNDGYHKLKALVDDCNVKTQVDFIGYQDDMMPFYQRSAIFVLSSRYEGFGMVLIEAMSQGCACIACDFKGRQREIVRNPEEGIVCPTDDVDALANAMKKLLVEKSLREKLQRNALIRSEYYSLENTMKRWDCILKQNKAY